MTLPRSIHGFLDEFERALKLSGRRRRRVVDEVRDHLIDATERGIGAGMDPIAAEIAAVDAFGDAATVASRFDRHFVARLGRRISVAFDLFDCWRVVHPTAATTFLIAPLAVPVAVLWSPLPALAFIAPWVALVWIGNELADRNEPGFRHRLWAWKGEHPGKYKLATNLGALFGFLAVFPLEIIGRLPHVSPWLLVVLAPLYPVLWILNSPRPYNPPSISAT